MITLGLGLLAFEAANRAHWLTGGSDGLQGVSMWPVLGLFKFDLYGYTAYTYSLAVLFLVFLCARRLINSPLGLALRGIRENWVRMSRVEPLCLVSPLTVSRIDSFCGSAISSRVATNGPSGAKVSALLPLKPCPPRLN